MKTPFVSKLSNEWLVSLIFLYIEKALIDKSRGTTPDEGIYKYDRDSFIERQSLMNLPDSLQ